MMLGAMHVGVPVVPVSTAYARLSQDFGKLRYIFELVEPGLIYVDDAVRYAKALRSDRRGAGVEIVASRGTLGTTALDALRTPHRGAADARRSTPPSPRVGPDTVAKILFTSGSTGQPKGVINTQRMLCANQESDRAAPGRSSTDHPPVIVDWLPWNHTFGGNHNFNMVLRNGGTLYIDEGKPVPALIGRTVAQPARDRRRPSISTCRAATRCCSITWRATRRCSENFFARLDLLFYAARRAAADPVGPAGARSASKVRGRKVPFISVLGADRDGAGRAPWCTSAIDRPGNIGVPGPGMAVKLVPVRRQAGDPRQGPERDARLLQGAGPDRRRLFDEEGWLRTGDAVRFADPDDPAAGLLFDGRVAENFKLSSGTWVNVGMLRPAVIAAGAPVIEDAVVTGHDRDEIGLLIFPSLAGLRSLCPDLRRATPGSRTMIAEPAVREALTDGLAGTTRRRRAARCASRAACCSPSRPPSTPTRSPTRATSTSAPC